MSPGLKLKTTSSQGNNVWGFTSRCQRAQDYEHERIRDLGYWNGHATGYPRVFHHTQIWGCNKTWYSGAGIYWEYHGDITQKKQFGWWSPMSVGYQRDLYYSYRIHHSSTTASENGQNLRNPCEFTPDTWCIYRTLMDFTMTGWCPMSNHPGIASWGSSLGLQVPLTRQLRQVRGESHPADGMPPSTHGDTTWG